MHRPRVLPVIPLFPSPQMAASLFAPLCNFPLLEIPSPSCCPTSLYSYHCLLLFDPAHSIFISKIVYIYVWVHNRSSMPMFCLKKINFSAPGGPKSTIFDTDDVDPLYFEVSIVSAPSDPPYMSKNGKMCYFYHFLRVPKKTYTQSTGLP